MRCHPRESGVGMTKLEVLIFTRSPSLGEKWASIVEQKRNIWILDESSIYDSTNRRFVERPCGSKDPWGVVDPLELILCLTRDGNGKLRQHHRVG